MQLDYIKYTSVASFTFLILQEHERTLSWNWFEQWPIPATRYEMRLQGIFVFITSDLIFIVYSQSLYFVSLAAKTINVYGQDRIFALMYTATMPLQACLLDGIGLWLACHCNAKVCLSENWRSYKLLKI